MEPLQAHEKTKLDEVNPHLTCYLCKGYLIDATTISECLHSFCRSCIIKFLQENCYCPVCEVIVNKAKPCLKLDKTLQDVVYKLVPGLFIKEMQKRKEFYQSRPELASKVSPEERGEDTERTIFNSQDAISLSIEYISDDSTPGAIPVLPMQNGGTTIESNQDNPMKRFLQCPAMCRIEVLKKFVINKYNVDTSLFHIDILYKRVPLPGHYTLMDIGYIYSWKRNEPMKFFFRITDLTKVAERFDYFNGRVSPAIIHTPVKIKNSVEKEKATKNNKDIIEKRKLRRKNKLKEKRIGKEKCLGDKAEISTGDKCCPETQKSPENNIEKMLPSKTNKFHIEDDKLTKNEECSVMNNESSATTGTNRKTSSADDKVITDIQLPKQKYFNPDVCKKESRKVQDISKNSVNCDLIEKVKIEVESESETKVAGKNEPLSTLLNAKCKSEKTVTTPIKTEVKLEEKLTLNPSFEIKNVENKSNEVFCKQEVKDELKSSTKCVGNIDSSVYTSLTLNREDNIETITKIHKMSDKNGQPIELNVINHTVKKTNNTGKVQSVKNRPKLVPTSSNIKSKTPLKKAEDKLEKEREEIEKSIFLKSFELTAKNGIKEHVKPVEKQIQMPSTSSAQKRKNSSPMKNDKTQEKKLKAEKKAMKIIIQPKGLSNPTVRQMVSNVNQNANNMSKIVEQSTTATKPTDIKTLIDNCKINIPASLSITLNESADGVNKTPLLIPPVKNFIEILKLPDSKTELSEGERRTSMSLKDIVLTKDKNWNSQSYQKIFEQTLAKKSPDLLAASSAIKENKKSDDKAPLDLTSSEPVSTSGTKRSISEIALHLQKKTKIEEEKRKEEIAAKIAIPRLPTQRISKPSYSKYDLKPQHSANMHSPRLGLNYTVSVDQKPNTSSTKQNQNISPSSSKNTSPSKNKDISNGQKSLNSNQLLEKYNIQNLSQVTANINFNRSLPFTSGQYNAFQRAMLMKQIGQQNWVNQAPLLHFEKYMQTLNNAAATQNQIMGNIKDK